MRNKTRLTFLLAMLLTLCSIGANATSLLDGKKWSKTSLSTNQPSGGFQKGGVQGAAILNGVMYQFRGAGDANSNIPTYDMYNISTGTWTSGGSLTNLANSHTGSANFGTTVFTSYTLNEKNYNCKIPFVYITNGNTIQIYDIENNVLVATWTLPKLDDDAIAAFDFASGTLWSIGYVSGSRKAPYLVREITGLNFTTLPTDRTFTTSEITSYTFGHSTEDYNDLQNGTIQDAQYVDGKIYFCAGGGSDYHRTEYCRVHVYDTTTHELVDTKMCADVAESEGFVYDTNTSAFLMTTGSTIWKLSAGTGYDNLYNFEPATLVDGYYQIDTASKLLWFKQQVYGGCQDIKAKLTADINMSGVTDPYSCYVYDINMPNERVYDATNAFTGEFDGQNHTINGYSITSTPYNNNGLFPYCIGATIKNLTVIGTIKLSKGTNSSGTSSQAVSNVGLIGYLDGGTVTNVDVSGLKIDTSVSTGVSGTVNKLIGGRGTNDITKSDNDESTYTHSSDGTTGHHYMNGFCVADGTCKAQYESVTDSDNDGIYEIDNAGKLWWFAKNISNTKGYNVKLTADIDMEGAYRGSFPGIGTTAYTGTFDGNGMTISNFYQKFTGGNHTGLFNTISSSAVVKHFNINGTVDIAVTNNQQQFGSVVGYAEGSTTLIEDVHSSVDINITGKVYTVGGIVGRAHGTVNRCWYSGTITVGENTYMRIGGVVGETHSSTCIVKNCLFDGTINASSSSDQLWVGGIVGGQSENTASTISNCFSNGTISIPNSTGTYSGIVCGMLQYALTMDHCYYTRTHVDSRVSAATSFVGVTAKETNKSELATDASLTNGYLLYNLQQDAGKNDDSYNWSAGTNYPIPVVGTNAGSSTETYTIIFKDHKNRILQQSHVEKNGTVTAPTPYRYGYTFKEWSPTFKASATVDATYTAIYDAATSTGTFSNGFNTDASCSADNMYETPTLTDGVYQIDNGGKLFWFARFVNNGNTAAKAILTAETINLESRDFTPIGSYDYNYTGTFDGNGKTISNLKITRNEDYTGLFSYTKNATIKNFTVGGTMTMTGGGYVGSVIGCAQNTTLEDVTSSVNITHSGKNNHIGGIAGRFYGTINRCRYNGQLKCTQAYFNIGGIIANAVSGSTTMTNCLFDGTLDVASTNTDMRVGGLIGYVESGGTGNNIKNSLVHATITLASGATVTSSGILVGKTNGSNTITLTDCYYTTSNVTNLSSAVGSNATTGTNSVTPTEVKTSDDLTDGTLLYTLQQNAAGHNGAKTEAYWIAGTNSPIPGTGEFVEEPTEYFNGFKTNGSTSDADYYQTPSTTTINDVTYYQIANAGELWYFSKNISTLGVSANAILTADIDMEETDVTSIKHGSFPGISGYKGIFNGNGKTISNYYQQWGQGMFTTTDGATIKNFTLTGNVYIKNGNAGAVVGIANDNTTIEDVTSSVYLQFTGKDPHVGGIAGRANGIMNRCRFNGKIESPNYESTKPIVYLGGIVGEAYHSYVGAGITNCLFDGEISVASTLSTLQIGGISGGNEFENPGVINHCFSHGTINIPSGYTGTQSGVVSGMASSNLTTLANYYTVSSSTGTTLTVGIGSSTDRMYHKPSCIATEVTESEDLTTGKLLEKLGSKNWVYDETLGYPKPLVGGGGEHTHSFDTDGFCVAMDIEDGGYQPVDAAGSDGYYAISNAGQLYDFATKVNAGLSANAKLTADINMEYVNFPGIGSDKNVYSGTFDGQGHSIINYARVCTTGGSGFFNYVSGTVKDFTISGNMFTKKSSDGKFGGVAGQLDNGKIEDVYSSVNITINYGEKYIAGIAGYGKGTINRCRYDGTIATVNYELKYLANCIAGICAYTENLTLKNCLFDGKIISYYNRDNSDGNQQIGGIVGRQQSGTLTLKNNLSNGTISLPNLTLEEYTTLTGIVLGYYYAGTFTASTNYYTTANCTYDVSNAFTAPYGTSSTQSVTTGSTPVEAAWSEILLALNNNYAEGTEGIATNWTITAGAEYPVPYYSMVEHVHEYDTNGYCTVKIGDATCEEAQPMGGDATTGYTIANAGQLASFRDLVSSSTVGTEINAKLTADIDLSTNKWTADDMIGSESKPYCGTFDGQGHTISGVHISPTTSKKHVGLFACVGLNGSGNNNGLKGNTMTVEGNVKNFTVSGSITNTQYYCNQDVDDPLDMGVIGELFDGTVQNVHSSVNLTSTNGSRVQVGGIVGGVHIASSENITAKAVIDQCSYGPSCGPTKTAEKAEGYDKEGIINVNGFDDIAGILGYMQHHVTITNCLYYGHIIQTYDETKIPSTATKGVTELYTQMGGILGYTTSSGTQGSTVNNNLVLGDFSVPESIAGTPFESTNMIYVHQDNGSEKSETAHHNVNAIVGYTGVKDFVTNCYASNHVSISAHTSNLQLNKVNNATNVTVNVETDDTFDRGMVTAEMNGNTTGDPWGQVLGYQMGWDGTRTWDKVTPSPSDLYPSPGYTAEKPCYKVVRTNRVSDSNDNTTYDYTADYYFFDDYGDTTPMPTDVTPNGADNTQKIKVKKIKYTRAASYMTGYISVCLPYDLTSEFAPANESGTIKYYKYKETKNNTIYFTSIDDPSVTKISAGTPFIMYNTSGYVWAKDLTNEDGYDVLVKADDYDDGSNDKTCPNVPDAEGLHGTFNTKYINNNYFKVHDQGQEIRRCTEVAHAYPFRVYFKLPADQVSSAKAKYSAKWMDEEDTPTQIEFTESDGSKTVVPVYNVLGQQVPSSTKGLVIKNGKKTFVK